jgi:glyoxylase-like metal-dependent hydrolase (beta-lactamase superfamily II)
VGAVADLMDRYQAPFYLHSSDGHLLKRANLYRMLFESREAVRIPSITRDIGRLPPTFQTGPFSVSWLCTPGHTEGSVCLRIGNFLFSGDTLMRSSIGRTDLPGGNRDQLLASVRKLMELPGDTVVCGGHGPRTTIAAELTPGAAVWDLLQ